jgi:hypothetical protein
VVVGGGGLELMRFQGRQSLGQVVANIAIIPARQVGRDGLPRNPDLRFIYFTQKCEIQ